MKRPSTQDIISRLYDIATEIKDVTTLWVDDGFDDDGYHEFRIDIGTVQTQYPIITMCREAIENMTDEDIEDEIRKEMEAWGNRLCNAQSPQPKLGNRFSNGAEKTA